MIKVFNALVHSLQKMIMLMETIFRANLLYSYNTFCCNLKSNCDIICITYLYIEAFIALRI